MSGKKSMKKLLIANRGEIAVRIIRAARQLGIETVAIYSEADEGSLYVRLADKKIGLGGKRAQETYLNHEKVINACLQSGADALHPGYGFLAENSEFAEKVSNEGILFVGPSAEVISLMGDKTRARKAAESAGVPIVPGAAIPEGTEARKELATKITYPLLVKSSSRWQWTRDANCSRRG